MKIEKKILKLVRKYETKTGNEVFAITYDNFHKSVKVKASEISLFNEFVNIVKSVERTAK